MKPYFFGIVESGRIKMDRPDDFHDYMAKFKPGTEIQMTVERRTNTRSDNQNRYYWGVVVKMIQEKIGEYDKDKIHMMLAIEFLRADDIEVMGKKYMCVRSTASLSTLAFEEYLEQCRQWALEHLTDNPIFPFIIPLPNEVEFDL